MKDQCLVWNFTEEDSVRNAAAVLGFGATASDEAAAAADAAASRFLSALDSELGGLEGMMGSAAGGLRARQSWGDMADSDSLDGDEEGGSAAYSAQEEGAPGVCQDASEGAPQPAADAGVPGVHGDSPPGSFANPCQDLSGAREPEGAPPGARAAGVPGPRLRAGAGLGGTERRFLRGISRPEDMRAAVAAALQCSDFRRRTALHVAVERDDMGLLLALVWCAVGCSGGAATTEGAGHGADCGPAGAFVVQDVVNARDVQHTTPLFAAAEQGYTSAVEVSSVPLSCPAVRLGACLY